MARLEDAASPPYSQRAQLAGEAIVAEKTGKKIILEISYKTRIMPRRLEKRDYG